MVAERRPVSRTALAWMMVGEWRAHPGRVATAALAIAVGVALGFAVHLVNGSAQSELTQAVRTINADSDLQVRSTTPLGFDEQLFPHLARTPGIAAASPVVERQARFGRQPELSLQGGGLTLLGLDPLRAVAVTPSLLGVNLAAATPSGGGFGTSRAFDLNAIALSPAALQASGHKVGERVEVTANGQTATFIVAGVLASSTSEQRIAVIDIATAQWRFGSLGRLQRISSGSRPAPTLRGSRPRSAPASPPTPRS